MEAKLAVKAGSKTSLLMMVVERKEDGGDRCWILG